MDPRPYRISDVVRMTGYSREYLRRLENDGLIPKPVRSRGRQRRYSEVEVRQIKDALAATARDK